MEGITFLQEWNGMNHSIPVLIPSYITLTSINSNPIDNTHKRGWLRIIIALPHHPKIWAGTNSSKSVSWKTQNNFKSKDEKKRLVWYSKLQNLFSKEKKIWKRLWKKKSYINIYKPASWIISHINSTITTIWSLRKLWEDVKNVKDVKDKVNTSNKLIYMKCK